MERRIAKVQENARIAELEAERLRAMNKKDKDKIDRLAKKNGTPLWHQQTELADDVAELIWSIVSSRSLRAEVAAA